MQNNNIVGKVVGGVLVLAALAIGAWVGMHRSANVSAVVVDRDWYTTGIKIGDTAESWATKTIGQGVDEVIVLRNDTSRPMYVDYGHLELIANAAGIQSASSTMNVRMFATSTTEALANSLDYTTVVPDKYLLVTGTWATSTTATTTNSVGTVSAGGQGSIMLPAGWALVAYVNRSTNGVCNTGACETATSSNRGFDIKARVHYHFEDPQ